MKKILILNGPNLNLLGKREPGVYGSTTLDEIASSIELLAKQNNIQSEFFQTNHEGVMVDKIQEILLQKNLVDFIIINPAAWTHTSVAVRDALLAVNVPFLEVHLSNVHAREDFRRHSYLSDKAVGVICGLGAFGYKAALEFAIDFLKKGQ
ncbi:MAG: type II 3-dehydroquinate dehydratase [Neisseriaceae bacterium]|jgi:3-dehydroquinate dehydratase-2|nr:MAG: type II 3-dehydroquinate dehydratase [Neisseriaceae bacterium]